MSSNLILSDPDILGGAPCIVSTRLPVYAVAARVKAGESAASMFDGYDDLSKEHVKAAVAYAELHPFFEDPNGRPWRSRPQWQAVE